MKVENGVFISCVQFEPESQKSVTLRQMSVVFYTQGPSITWSHLMLLVGLSARHFHPLGLIFSYAESSHDQECGLRTEQADLNSSPTFIIHLTLNELLTLSAALVPICKMMVLMGVAHGALGEDE